MSPTRRRTDEAVHSIEDALRGVHEGLDQLSHRTELIEKILMLKDPGSTVAAEAYDGLRKQVIAVANERLAHLSQLAQFDAAVRHRASLADLAVLLQDWMESAGLACVSDPSPAPDARCFEIVEDLGGELEIIEPAYLDGPTGRIIRQGRARRGAPLSRIEGPAGGDQGSYSTANEGSEAQ